LAREFGVDVVATDWWISADQAAAVFAEAGVADRVHQGAWQSRQRHDGRSGTCVVSIIERRRCFASAAPGSAAA